MAKKFKTIRGALRSIIEHQEHEHWKRTHHLKREETNDEIIAGDEAHVRVAINHVLPQVLVNEQIAADEKPRAGLERIKSDLTDPAQLKAVDECLSFVNNRIVFLRATTATDTRQAG